MRIKFFFRHLTSENSLFNIWFLTCFSDCNVIQKRISQRKVRFLQDIFTTLVDSQWRWTLIVFALSFVLSWLFFAGIWWLIAVTHGDLEPNHLPPVQRMYTTIYYIVKINCICIKVLDKYFNNLNLVNCVHCSECQCKCGWAWNNILTVISWFCCRLRHWTNFFIASNQFGGNKFIQRLSVHIYIRNQST